MLDLSKNTVVDWFQFFRDVASHWLLENRRQLGGVGRVVEIDESLVSKRKANRDRQLPQRWVFGIYDVEAKVGYLQEVPDRSAATLLPIIERYIAPGSIIRSDEWAAYRGI